MLDPTKKYTPRPRAKEKPQQDSRRGKIVFRIKLHTHQRCLEGSNKTLYAPGDPTETKPNLPWSVWVSPAEVWVSSGLPQGHGLWVQQTGVWYKPSWRRSPLTPPYSRQNLHWIRKTDSWRAQTKPCTHQDPGDRSSDPTRDWSQLAHECPGVSSRGVGQWWPAAGLGTLSACTGHFKGDRPFLYYLQHSLVSGQTTRREHSPTHWQKIGLKIYWAWPHPWE